MSTIWKTDAAHSELTFKVRHLMISNVKGEFRNFEATIESEGNNFESAKVNATVQTDSIFTNNTDRDTHLRSADFFDAEKYPQLIFAGTGLVKNGDDYQLNGNLTIKGITKPIVLAVEFGGVTTDPYGQTKAGFSFSGKINRSDYGLTWNAALETGGVMVSEEVKIIGEVQLIKQAS